MGKDDDLKIGSVVFSDPNFRQGLPLTGVEQLALRDSMMNNPARALQRTGSARDPRTAQAGPAATPPPDPDRYATIDLSALPPAARPAVAAALQAAVGRLATGELPIEPRRAEDALLAELLKGQMRTILARAAVREAGEIDACRHGTPYRYACEACGDGPIDDEEPSCPHGIQERYGCAECGTKNYDDGWG